MPSGQMDIIGQGNANSIFLTYFWEAHYVPIAVKRLQKRLLIVSIRINPKIKHSFNINRWFHFAGGDSGLVRS
jgi:hypothetical protein